MLKKMLQRKLYHSSLFRVLIALLFLVGAIRTSYAEESDTLILEPVVQTYRSDDYVYAYTDNGKVFLPIFQLGRILGIKVKESNNVISGFFMSESRTYEIDFKTMTGKFDGRNIPFTRADVREIEGQVAFDVDFYEKLLPVEVKIDELEMQLVIESPEKLPSTLREEAKKKRDKAGISQMKLDSFSNYEFDNRWWSTPVVDLTYNKNWAKSDIGGDNERTNQSDSYGVNFGMLAAGLDTNLYLFGDNNNNDWSPRARLTAGRTFLQEPKNALNLTKFEMGDITGYNTGYFARGSSGRGIMASSFKDLVMSADKTIDINGPLQDGWEVELYLNNQLIGFRQGAQMGRYEFPNIPVSYGLNDFRLVFYGPYGEVKTEDRRYYSGTSPVKTGEFGYVANVYQPNRYLFEENESYTSDSDKVTADFVGYYGFSDNLTGIAGYTATPDAVDENLLRHFGMVGAQAIMKGASFQYNMGYDLENAETDHHFEVQGDVYVGNILARYEYYGDIESPVAYQYGGYLKDLFEGRLTGVIAGINLPYYLSYKKTQDHQNNENESVSVRLSPNFKGRYNFTIEDLWESNSWYQNKSTNDVSIMLQTYYDRLTMSVNTAYRTHPDEYWKEFGARVYYRWNKNTYFNAMWRHDFRSKYLDNQDDLDTFSLSGSRLFPIGGLSLDMSYDTDKNFSVGMRYNISFGRKGDRNSIFADAQTKLSERGTIFAKAIDENGNALSGISIFVNGLEAPVVTDEKGEAVLTDLQAYERVIVSVDPESVDDVSLTPLYEVQKRVLRPGAVLPLTIPFVHRGAFEGQLTQDAERPQLLGYKIEAVNVKDNTVYETYSDVEGFFILDGVAYGTYNVNVYREDDLVKTMENIKLDDVAYFFEESIEIPYVEVKREFFRAGFEETVEGTEIREITGEQVLEAVVSEGSARSVEQQAYETEGMITPSKKVKSHNVTIEDADTIVYEQTFEEQYEEYASEMEAKASLEDNKLVKAVEAGAVVDSAASMDKKDRK